MENFYENVRKQSTRMKYLSKFALSPYKHMIKDAQFRHNMLYAHYLETSKINPNMVLFETSHGSKLAGNPYAIFKAMFKHKDYKNYRFVLVLNDENHEAIQYKDCSNVIFVKRDSANYLRYLAEAKYLINDTTFPFYFQKKKGQVYVNTWHGTPIKTLGKDVKGTIGQHKNAIRNFLHADYIINPNKFTADVITRAHDLENIYNGFIIDEGYPRMDLTINADKVKVKENLQNVLGLKLDKKIVLYAPTWRGEIGKISNTEEELVKHIKTIHENMPDDYIFLLKVHDLTYRFIKDNNELQEICIPDWMETNELLSIVDILITDYSSIFFDFMPTKKPILFFVYDREQYEHERGLYLSLDDMPGPLCQTVEEVLESIKSIESVIKTYQKKYENMLHTYCYHDDGKATERFLNIVFNEKRTPNMWQVCDKEKVKLLIYGGGFTTNGVTTSLLNLLKNLDYSKYDVTIMYGGKMNQIIENNLKKLPTMVKVLYRMGSCNFTLAEYYQHRLVMNSGLNKNRIRKLIPKKLYQKELQRLIGDATFDIAIDFSGYSPFWTLMFAFNEFNKKAVYLHSDMVEDSNRLINGKPKFVKNFNIIFNLYQYYDKLVCVSKEATETNKQKLFDYKISDKIINVDNAIDYERVLKQSREIEVHQLYEKNYVLIENKNENGVLFIKAVEFPQNNHVNFVTLGRLSPEKDHVKLIKAFSNIHQLYSNTKLYIIGGGELKNQLEKFIQELNLQDSIYLVGPMDNPFALVNECDCFVMPSNYEGQGLVILEALMLKKPVISTDIPGPRGILQQGYGELVENSEEGLFLGMKDFISNQKSYKEFDYIQYNQSAMNMFYQEICNIEKK